MNTRERTAAVLGQQLQAMIHLESLVEELQAENATLKTTLEKVSAELAAAKPKEGI